MRMPGLRDLSDCINGKRRSENLWAVSMAAINGYNSRVSAGGEVCGGNGGLTTMKLRDCHYENNSLLRGWMVWA